MATFDFSIQLQDTILQRTHEALEEVANETLSQWKKLIQTRIYEKDSLKASPQNNYYERTNQLLDSLELSWVSPLEVVLDYNTDKIIPSITTNEFSFNKHASLSQVDWSDAIPYFAEIGNGESKVHSYEGVHAQEDICNMLVKSYNAMLTEALKKRGIVINK